MSEHFDWVMGAVLPYINFALFVTMAIYFFRKPLSSMAQKRRKDYEQVFAEAKKAKEEAERQSKELNERLANLDAEMEEITANAQKVAEEHKRKVKEDALAVAEHIKAEASRVAEAELENALRELRLEIVTDVTHKVSEKVQQELDPEGKGRVINRQIASLKNIGLGEVH